MNHPGQLRAALNGSLFVAGFFALTTPVAAREQEEAVLESTRFHGRGGTYVAAYDSDDATRGNPATLAESNITFQLRWLQLDVMPGSNTVGLFSDILDLQGGAGSSAVTALNTISDKLGKRLYGRGQLMPLALRFGPVEISPFASEAFFFDSRVPATPELEISSDTITGANFSIGIPVGKELMLGLTLRPMYRTRFSGKLAFSDIIGFIDDSNLELDDIIPREEGTQFAANVGAVWKPGKAWRFGLLADNVGYAGDFGEFSNSPPNQQQKVSIGTNYRIDWKPWFWDWAFDYQDLLNPQGLHMLRLMHFGTELGRTYISRDTDLGLQLGINEGYFTTGAYVDVLIARLNVSYYAVELGEYPGQRKDRRWAFTLQSTMTF